MHCPNCQNEIKSSDLVLTDHIDDVVITFDCDACNYSYICVIDGDDFRRDEQ